MTPRDKRVAKQELKKSLCELKRRERLYKSTPDSSTVIKRHHENYLAAIQMKIAELKSVV
jgi:hypothetical protein